jgi:hypothetical protein
MTTCKQCFQGMYAAGIVTDGVALWVPCRECKATGVERDATRDASAGHVASDGV